jgi:hypothetical protein
MRRRPLVGALALAAFLAAVFAISFLGSAVPGARTPSGLELTIQLAIIAAAILLIAGAIRRRG